MADKQVSPKLMTVQPSQVVPNKWNPNRMNDETFDKEIRSIETNGFIDPITIREVRNAQGDPELEIVDGEHRWRAAKKLGLKEIPAVNLGEISDAQAKKLTIITNELRGAPEPVLLAALLNDLNETIEVSELALHLPMSAAEIDGLIRGASTFDWSSFASPNDAIGRPHAPSEAPGANNSSAQVRLGSIKGDIPNTLLQTLYAEFERSAQACGSRTLEVVLRHWTERLQSTADHTDAEIAARPVVQATKKRQSKRAKEVADA